MIINIKGKDVELKYSFNSFKYMQELEMGRMAELQQKPFLIVGMLEILLLGAVNHNPKEVFSIINVQKFLEGYIEENKSVPDLMETLMKLLQESSFFKSLQKNQETQENQ